MNSEVRSQIEINGYTLIRGDSPTMSTVEAISRYGNPVTLSGFATVQNLKLIGKERSTPNTYSGNFGRSDFPLHTDLAHWSVPPRYVVLRCILGVAGVATRLVDGRDLAASIGQLALMRALVQPRRPLMFRRPLLRLLEYKEKSIQLLRWDSLFITPASHASAKTFDAVLDYTLSVTPIEVTLIEPGDTLLIDNWRMLHGRSKAELGHSNRQIDRVYIDELS